MFEPLNLRYETLLRFWVDGRPEPQPRQRGTMVAGHVKMYTPNSAEAWKRQVMVSARTAAGANAAPIDEMTRVDVHFFFRRPQELCRKKSPQGFLPHTGLKDVDNLWKAATDALVDENILKDDRTITVGQVSKWFTCAGGRSGALITIARPAYVHYLLQQLPWHGTVEGAIELRPFIEEAMRV